MMTDDPTAVVDDEVVSVLDAAVVLGIDVADAYRMIFSGDLASVQSPGGRFMVRRGDLRLMSEDPPPARS